MIPDAHLPDPSPFYQPLSPILEALESGLVERRQAVRLTLLAALAGEHSLLIGPPGTAKSALAKRLHLAFRDAVYFERLLTRFSVPEELFGPLSISALEQDRYERQTAGFLPQANIAFIDEVFKANSAILNALLTLLNEREFDNGAVREVCPLISVIGATNQVPDDEIGEAFFDRFLLRLPVGPVSAAGFRRLLDLDPRASLPAFAPLDESFRRNLSERARTVNLPAEVAEVLAELRRWLTSENHSVSDRRWVKILWLLKIAAASEGRAVVALWDLWLLPWGTAPDPIGQKNIADWLTTHLGVAEPLSPSRLSRVVEAFEAQLDIEQNTNDLDYDESGRLRFSTELDSQLTDAKGAAQVMRLTHSHKRRYGAAHIGARVGQIDELLTRLDDCAQEVAGHRAELADYCARSLWMEPDFPARADANLAATAQAVEELRRRAELARAGFEGLPRLSSDPGARPEPVVHEPLPK